MSNAPKKQIMIIIKVTKLWLYYKWLEMYLIFSAEKLPKRLNLFSSVFYHYTWVFKLDFSFWKAKSRNQICSHRIQYSKILKSPK